MGGVASKGSCLGDTGVARRSTSDSSGADATFLQQQQQQQEQLEQQQQWEYMLACYGMRPPIPPLPAIPEDVAKEEADVAGEEAEVFSNGQLCRRSAQLRTPPIAATAVMSHAREPPGTSVSGSVSGPAVASPHAVAEGRAWRPALQGSSFSCAEGSEAKGIEEPLGDDSASGSSHASWEDEHLRMSESACSEASEPSGGELVLPPPSPTSSSTQLLELPEDALAKVLQHLHRGRDRHAFLHSCKALRDSAKCLAQLRTLTLFPRLHSEDADLEAQLASVPKGARITNLIIRAPVCDMHLLVPSILRGLSQHASQGRACRVDFAQVEELQLKLAARCPDEPAAALAECLSFFPNLARLTIKAPYISPLLLQHLSSSRLHSLTLNMAAEQPSQQHYAAIGGIYRLASLKLKTRLPEWDEPTDTDPDFDSRSQPLVEDVSPLSSLRDLQHLEIRHVKWCDDESVPELEGLQSVLDNCPLMHLALYTPARYPRLKCPATLKHLSLPSASLQGLPDLTEPSLHVLEVPHLRVEVCEEGLLEQGAAMRCLCSIPCFICRDLEVCSSTRGVSPCGGLLECLAESTAQPQGVRSLTLTCVKVEPEEVKQLGAHFPCVSSLSFSSCELGLGCLAAAAQEFHGLESLYVWLCIKPRVVLLPRIPDAHELASVLEYSRNLCLALSVSVDILERERDASCQDSVRSWRREVDETVPSDLKQRLVVSCWLNIKEAGGCMHGVRI